MNRRQRVTRKRNRDIKIRKNKKIKIITTIVATIILLILMIFGANPKILNEFSNLVGLNITFEEKKEDENQNQTTQFSTTDDLKVYFIDVGQADSILILNGEQSMLIDAGNNDDGQDVVDFIKDKGVEKLDYVVGTHPHEDHIGGLDDVIDNFDIGNVYMPKIETTTQTFEDVLNSIENKNLKVTSPSKGDTFSLGQANMEIMTNPILDENNLNLSSITIRLEFGNTSFLFMGDSEKKNEKTRQWPKTDVLKVGHHGSNTSSDEEFLNQVMPEIAVVMVGENNGYNLPSDKIIKRLEDIGAKIYRTDKDGTIEMVSNGNEIQLID